MLRCFGFSEVLDTTQGVPGVIYTASDMAFEADPNEASDMPFVSLSRSNNSVVEKSKNKTVFRIIIYL